MPLSARPGATVDATSAPPWLSSSSIGGIRQIRLAASVLEFGVRACLYVGHHPSPSRVPNSRLADLGLSSGCSSRPAAIAFAHSLAKPTRPKPWQRTSVKMGKAEGEGSDEGRRMCWTGCGDCSCLCDDEWTFPQQRGTLSIRGTCAETSAPGESVAKVFGSNVMSVD